MIDETRARFMNAIAKQVSPERIIEAHFFSGIRQGGSESGVAVLALERVLAAPAVDPEPAVETTTDLSETTNALAPDEAAAADAIAETQQDETVPEVTIVRPASRYTVYTAHYRHTLKGLDRGKWEVSVTEEADAPLLTIDAVVRGVQRRSGDVDDAIRLSGDEFRAALPIAAA